MSTTFGTIPAAVVTYAVPLAFAGPHNPNGQVILASVVAADANATTFVMDCLPWETQVCALHDLSLTVGPWARMTPAPEVTTGSYDILQAILVESIMSSGSSSNAPPDGITRNWTTTVHCDMTSTTVPTQCSATFQTALPLNTPLPPADVIASPAFAAFGALPAPITITAGFEKLASLIPSSAVESISVASPTSSFGTIPVSIIATYTAGTGTDIESDTAQQTGTNNPGVTTEVHTVFSTVSSLSSTSTGFGVPRKSVGSRQSALGLVGVLCALITC